MAVKNDIDYGFQTVYFSEGESRRTNEYNAKATTLGEFIQKCIRHKRTPETLAQYAAMTKEQAGDAKDVGGFVGGTFRDNHRGSDYLEKRTMITLDLDKGQYSPAELLTKVSETLGGVAVVGYTSHSHTSTQTRIRIVVPLKKPVTPERYTALAGEVIERCGISDFADDCSTRPAQLFYWPSAPADAPIWAAHVMGPLFEDKGSISPVVTPQNGQIQYPEAPKTVKSVGGRLSDPRDKPGIIGAFCRAWHPISTAIETYLAGVYEKAGRDRYRYIGSNSEAGLIIKDGGLYAYSNHTNSDPAADGHCHNAYDLCRIHLCGGDDALAQDFALKDQKVVRQLFPVLKDEDDTTPDKADDTPSPMQKKEHGAVLADDETWVSMLELKKDGSPKNTPTNARIILENDPKLKGAIHFNLHSDDLTAMPSLPWFKKTHHDAKEGAAWSDPDTAALALYFSDNYRFIGEKSIDIAVEMVSRDFLFHPIRNYLRSLQWDGTPRLERMVIDYLGAEDNPCTRQMTELMMVGAVARVFNPGVKFDYMTIFQGEQGTFKSTLCRVLFSPWYLDEFNFNGNKDELERIRGIWGIEVGELAGMRKAEIQNVKGTVSRQEDIYRSSYGRRAQRHPRQCIFIGTTNETHFLKDDKNRRFCLIPIVKKLRKFGEYGPEALERDKDQLWAEAMHLYKTRWEGKPLILSRENAEEQERRNQGVNMNKLDPVRADLEDYLNRPLPPDWNTWDKTSRRTYFERGSIAENGVLRREFSLKAFLWEVYGCSSEVEAKKKDASLAGQLGNRVAGYLRELGQWDTPKQKRTIYGTCKVYKRLDNPYIDAPEDDEL